MGQCGKDRLNAATKFVATHRPESLEWGPAESIGPDIVEGVRRIKAEDGLEHRTDIVTTFDLIDLREGRGEGSEASASLESPSPLR